MESLPSRSITRKLLNLLLNTRGQIQIKANGSSMYPNILNDSDIVIEKGCDYISGDILVFDYQNEGLLVHRLIATTPTFICKGDNAFRMEEISSDCIVGKVVSINGYPVRKWENWEIELSKKIGLMYLKSQNAEKVISSSVFKLYATTILNKNKGYIIYSTEDFLDISYNPLNKSCDCSCNTSKIIRYYGIESYIINRVWYKPKIEDFFNEMKKYMESDTNITFQHFIYSLIKLLDEKIIFIK